MAETAPTSGGTVSQPVGSSSGQVGPADIWNALLQIGASAVQAAGLMGNAIAESGLNPEAQATDTNGYTSSGLWQWNEASHPGSSSLVTGNPAKDLVAQVNYLAQTGGLRAATGNTPAQVASNFAANYERCATCQPGGQSNTQRESYATQAAGWAQSGNWPTTSSQASQSAQLTASGGSSCAWQLSFGGSILTLGQSANFCIISKSQARAVLSIGILIVGAGLMLYGIGSLTGITSGLVGTATRVAGVLGAPETGGASLAVAQAAQERHTASQYRKQRRARENYARDEDREPVPF